jgi:hypothetical protein
MDESLTWGEQCGEVTGRFWNAMVDARQRYLRIPAWMDCKSVKYRVQRVTRSSVSSISTFQFSTRHPMHDHCC